MKCIVLAREFFKLCHVHVHPMGQVDAHTGGMRICYVYLEVASFGASIDAMCILKVNELASNVYD